MEWAKHILSQVYIIRCNHEDEISKAGYDVSLASKNLEDFYLEKQRGI
ncbi:MAG: hypothetical protein LUH02_04960 [Erysipelotrichaceae bacterium]|nr:hypothetical protein [Erysipelotrichaceae bacterium]